MNTMIAIAATIDYYIVYIYIYKTKSIALTGENERRTDFIFKLSDSLGYMK